MPVTQHTKWTIDAGPPALTYQVSTVSEADDEPPPPFEDQQLHARLVEIAMGTEGFVPVAGFPILDWTVPPS